MSASRGDGGYYGRTPSRNAPPGSVRRSSQYSGRASAAALAQINQPKTEMRPIRDKQWIAMAAQTVMDHLIENRFPLPLERKMFDQGPTLKLFQAMFMFLTHDVLYPGYVFGKGGRKFEEDVITLMKDLRYPHADQISRTALQAAGSGHAWPATLAMLYWMVELSQAKLQWFNPEMCDDPNLTPIEKLSPEQSNMPERYFIDYLNQAYRAFLDGSDDFSDLDQQLRQSLGKVTMHPVFQELTFSGIEQSNGAVIQETERKAGQLKKTVAEIEQIMSHVRVIQSPRNERDQLEKEHELQLADSVKFQKMIEHNNQKKSKLEDALQVLNAAISEAEERLVALRTEHGGLLKAVEEQNLSPEEATRMTTERDTLARTLKDLHDRVAEASKTQWEREMAVAKRGSSMEDAIQEYMQVVYRAGLFPDAPKPFDQIQFGLDVNLTAPPAEMLNADIRHSIRPAVTRFGEERRLVRTRLDDERIVVEDELDRLTQFVENQKEELENREVRLNQLLERADEIREHAATETADSNLESARLEREVANIRTAAQQSALGLDSRLQALEIEYADLQHKTARLRDEVLKEVVNHTEAIVTFRTQVSASLDSLALYAENN
ncbi:hypothetical protein DACRYDRAFT_74568 [Dacryopinax primogenitus]|uniref:Kinetochore protein NDC80 n=1 Tax=Dacryopinax primogenitus (strain DJM 731) TaxID=1858805 RepID=M5GAH8_DACPD|nr:uncharacterized protein DACRYDRAFT_74568 [Dacryopinax primogenitus]EJU05360.1 hypothetical protein DACRYDRAFT_74568 [Dacryopinax primogenitus]